MASEKFRKILPYISIGVGILVYVLYYMSTESWKQAQSDYERQLVEERQAQQRADNKLVKETKPWISEDGKEVYKVISREEKDGLTWIKLKELNEDMTYNLKYVQSVSGEKYTSTAGNLFWIKGNEAIFENSEKKTSNLKSTQVYRGLYSYMADANSFKICNNDKRISIAMLGENIEIEQAYSTINNPGEDVYLEVEGAMIKEMNMKGTEMIDAIYPHKILKIEDRRGCE